MEQITLDQHYRFGDVAEAIDACDELEALLGRLRRQHLIDDAEWRESTRDVATIRRRLEAYIMSSALIPKGPRLP